MKAVIEAERNRVDDGRGLMVIPQTARMLTISIDGFATNPSVAGVTEKVTVVWEVLNHRNT